MSDDYPLEQPEPAETVQSLMRYSQRELARRLVICERVRKHWRVLAAQAALGQIKFDRLLGVCFQELIGNVPTDEMLNQQLAQVVRDAEERDEELESLERMFGPLRSIDLDGGK